MKKIICACVIVVLSLTCFLGCRKTRKEPLKDTPAKAKPAKVDVKAMKAGTTKDATAPAKTRPKLKPKLKAEKKKPVKKDSKLPPLPRK